MKTFSYIWLLSLLFAFSFAFSQKRINKNANKDYNDFAYAKTSRVLQKVADKGYRSVSFFQKLGNSYYFINKMEQASKWYAELMALGEKIDPEYYFRYAQSLKTLERYGEADQWMHKFHDARPEDKRGKAFVNNLDYLSKIKRQNRKNITIKNLELNSALSDFGSAVLNDKLIFASAREGVRKHLWFDQPFLELYEAIKKSDDAYGGTKRLNNAINTKYHESSAAFSPDGKHMYYTRNNYYKNKYRTDKDGTNRLKIFRASLLDDASWGNIVSVHFNSDDYSVSHPAINADGTCLYFVSDMPGSLGKSDIYFAKINGDGSLGAPVNLGADINTEGKETFPYMNNNGDLYFSSNGYPGLGGLDIYVLRGFDKSKEKSTGPDIPKNIGRPINSPHDDFAYFENPKTKEGFFTSNRPGGKGDDDIYSFALLDCDQSVEYAVIDEDSGLPLSGATVILFDKKGNEIARNAYDEDSNVRFELECDKEYLLRAENEGYTMVEKSLLTPSARQEIQIELPLTKEVPQPQIKTGDDLTKILGIPKIHFDFDNYNIRHDAEIELQKILKVLTEHPNMKIDIRGHTDCRGSHSYNQTLSENRANYTQKYLIGQGISTDRLTSRGLGESQLLNHCECEATQKTHCTEKEHQQNRRSEFIVIKK